MKNTAFALLMIVCLGPSAGASAQILESVGARAIGMGGAFVAVANDSTATWWNPAGLASGPFIDASLGRAMTEVPNELPARRDRTSWFTMAALPVGISYYRFRVTEAASTAQARAGRQEEGTDVRLQSLSASQAGVTLVQTLLPGVHAGATFKYERGTLRSAIVPPGASASDLLDEGQDLEGGDGHSTFDLDVGVLAVGGPLRVGAVLRNVRQPEFEGGPGMPAMRLPRQFRAGVAFDGGSAGMVPLTVAVDLDLRRYEVGTGERRVIAVGAEQWIVQRRVAIRGGGRFNTVGPQDRAATAGASVAVRSGLYIDGEVVRGGSDDERGWGLTARVSF